MEAMMITISKTNEATVNVNGVGGYYEALNASGKGKLVAKIQGATKADLGQGCDGALVGSTVWALRDVLAMAERSEQGLSVVK
jgi:hypothetical protein